MVIHFEEYFKPKRELEKKSASGRGLPNTPHVVVVGLIVVVDIARGHVDVVRPCAIGWDSGTRPIVVRHKASHNNSFRLNHDNLLSLKIFGLNNEEIEERKVAFFFPRLFAHQASNSGKVISFVRTFSNSLFDSKYPRFSRTRKNMRSPCPADVIHSLPLHMSKVCLYLYLFQIHKQSFFHFPFLCLFDLSERCILRNIRAFSPPGDTCIVWKISGRARADPSARRIRCCIWGVENIGT